MQHNYPKRSNKLTKSSAYKSQAGEFREALHALYTVYPYTYLGSIDLRDLPYAKHNHYFVCKSPNIPEGYDYDRLVKILIRAVKKIGEESLAYSGDDLRIFLNMNTRKIMQKTMQRYLVSPNDIKYVVVKAESGLIKMSDKITPGMQMPADFKPEQIRRREIERSK